MHSVSFDRNVNNVYVTKDFILKFVTSVTGWSSVVREMAVTAVSVPARLTVPTVLTGLGLTEVALTLTARQHRA